MDLNNIIRSAVTPIVSDCIYGTYAGDSAEYCYFNYSSYPDNFADNAPGQIGYSIQVHYCAPNDDNPLATLTAICDALYLAGLDYPNIVDASDDVCRHYVLETGWYEVRS